MENPNSEAYKYHISRIKGYLWVAEDGMKMQKVDQCQGYNGSQFWDVALSVQAILATNLEDEYDCTAEGLKAAILLSNLPFETVGKGVETKQLYDAVNYILSITSTSWLDHFALPHHYRIQMVDLHPTSSQDLMHGWMYVECTSAAIQSLALFTQRYPGHRRKEIETCINKAAKYIESIQLADGSWYGSWGICYTCGTWFGIKGLMAAGKRYTQIWKETSHVVNTAWAMLALIEAGQAQRDPTPLHR
ncbi:hypothetical protein RJT34_21752 [Clitoria ternatea]|uniref:Squalene cyclase C-terminal domain-containing protein n=1 Tax=Clitoria ternatea TaxID=43366 RepID=A0AAN9P5X0_CLITE